MQDDLYKEGRTKGKIVTGQGERFRNLGERQAQRQQRRVQGGLRTLVQLQAVSRRREGVSGRSCERVAERDEPERGIPSLAARARLHLRYSTAAADRRGEHSS